MDTKKRTASHRGCAGSGWQGPSGRRRKRANNRQAVRAHRGPPSEETRRAWRNLLLSTPGLGEFISGVILYEETLGQRADDGTPLPEMAARRGIVPGIRADKGKLALAHAPGDEITEGLDGVGERLAGLSPAGRALR